MIAVLEAGAYAAESTSARNYMLMEANTLKGRYERGKSRPFIDVVSLLGSVPSDRLLANITPRLKPDTDPALERTLTLRIADREETYTLNIRRGILRIVPGSATEQTGQAGADPWLELSSSDLVLYALRALTVQDALVQEKFESNDANYVIDFFSHMD